MFSSSLPPPPFYFSKRGNIDVYFFFSFENIRKKERVWFSLVCFALESFFYLFAPFCFFSIEWTQNPCMAEKCSLKCFCKAQFSLFFFLIFLLLSTCVIFKPQITFINMILKKLFSKWDQNEQNILKITLHFQLFQFPLHFKNCKSFFAGQMMQLRVHTFNPVLLCLSQLNTSKHQ